MLQRKLANDGSAVITDIEPKVGDQIVLFVLVLVRKLPPDLLIWL